MRKLYFLSVLLVLISCTKDSSSRAGNFFFYTTAKPFTNNQVQGVRTTCDVIKFKGGDKKSLSITFYVNGYFVQTGFHTFNNSTIPFTGVYLNGQQVGVDVTFISSPVLKFGTKQSFGIYNAGNGKWRTAVDGLDCLEIDLGGTYGDNVELYTETGPVSTPGRFPLINFYPAIEIYNNGVWSQVDCGISSASTWGIEGKWQNGQLRDDEINIGGNLPVLPYGTSLWCNF